LSQAYKQQLSAIDVHSEGATNADARMHGLLAAPLRGARRNLPVTCA
jgi:hypothetical protein